MSSLEEIRRWARGRKIDGLPKRKRAIVTPGLTTAWFKVNTDGDDAILLFGEHNGKSVSHLAQSRLGRSYLRFIDGEDFPQELKAVCEYRLLKWRRDRKKNRGKKK